MFFAVEGIDGAGKSSVIQGLNSYLKTRIPEEISTIRTPGAASEVGKTLRDLLLNPRFELCSEAMPLLFLADMLQVDRYEVRPALEAGKIVLADRYVDSTYVYQINTSKLMNTAEGLRLAQAIVPVMYSVLTMPDMVFILDVEPEEARRRLDTTEYGSADRFEAQQLVWEARRLAYHFLANGSVHESLPAVHSYPEYTVVDVTSKGVQEVVEEIGAQIITKVQSVGDNS